MEPNIRVKIEELARIIGLACIGSAIRRGNIDLEVKDLEGLRFRFPEIKISSDDIENLESVLKEIRSSFVEEEMNLALE